MRIELKDENQEEPQKIDENDIRYKHETDLTKKEKRELEKMKLASMEMCIRDRLSICWNILECPVFTWKAVLPEVQRDMPGTLLL